MMKDSPTILIAEDSYGMRHALKSIFEDAGFVVFEAENEDGILKYADDASRWVIDARLPSNEYEGVDAVKKLVEGNIWPKRQVAFISIDPMDRALSKLRVLDKLFERKLERMRSRVKPYIWIEKTFEITTLFERVCHDLSELQYVVEGEQ